MKKFSFLLCLAMLCNLAACSGAADDTKTDDSQSGSVSTDTEPVETERSDVSDGLGNKDWGGREFRILATDYLANDFISEEETGALMSDAVYRRNRTIEGRFNTVISTNATLGYMQLTSAAASSIMAGEDAYDLILNHMVNFAQLAAKHYFYDFNDIEHIDVNRPWWNYSSYENLSVNGRSYLLIGSISPYFLGSYYCVYFNKRLALDYGINDSLYGRVLDGKFTIDYYNSLIKDKWKDLNGNGEQDDDDFYGLAAQVTSYATPFIYSFGETTVKNDKNGIPHVDMNNEKFADIVSKVYSLLFESGSTITTTGWNLHRETFMDGRALFFNGVFKHSYKTFTDFDDDYGMLPFPKWDEDQENYYTMSDGSSPLAAIPVTVSDTDFAGMITEAMAAESWRSLIPTVYDVALKVRGARDERSLEIIDMIANSAIIDFGFVYSDGNGMGFTLSNLMGQQDNNYASYYAENINSWEAKIGEIVDAFMEE